MMNFSKWKIGLVLLVCFYGVLGAMPNFLNDYQVSQLETTVLPSSRINLGLDLQGGAHMLLEVDTQGVIDEWLLTIRDDVRDLLNNRNRAFDSRIRSSGLKIDATSVFFTLTELDKADEAETRLKTLIQTLTSTALVIPQPDMEVSVEGAIYRITPTEQGIESRKSNAVLQTVEVIRHRVDEMGTREPTIQRQGTDRVVVQVPGLQNTEGLKEILQKTAKMSFNLVDETVSPADLERGRVPGGTIIMPTKEGTQIAIRRRALVNGEDLVDSQPTFDQQRGTPVVSFRFNSKGARQFGEATRKNVGRRFAIVLDKEVISAPRIDSPILGGSGIIYGGFTIEEATNLSVLLRAGALPADINIVEERSVGPDLGADSIAAGKIAAIYGMIAVLVYMVLSYGMTGFLANVALLFNISLIAAALATFGATLTLPGIAGIVLTIGMAVDANVLIFERIREELSKGKKALTAADLGYSQALTTILDANITTLIAAVIMFQFGSGPIKGFSITLAIGIITSVFTAVTLTRLFVSVWLRTRKDDFEYKL
jgi:protein-export membrane protein SecD